MRSFLGTFLTFPIPSPRCESIKLPRTDWEGKQWRGIHHQFISKCCKSSFFSNMPGQWLFSTADFFWLDNLIITDDIRGISFDLRTSPFALRLWSRNSRTISIPAKGYHVKAWFWVEVHPSKGRSFTLQNSKWNLYKTHGFSWGNSDLQSETLSWSTRFQMKWDQMMPCCANMGARIQ